MVVKPTTTNILAASSSSNNSNSSNEEVEGGSGNERYYYYDAAMVEKKAVERKQFTPLPSTSITAAPLNQPRRLIAAIAIGSKRTKPTFTSSHKTTSAAAPIHQCRHLTNGSINSAIAMAGRGASPHSCDPSSSSRSSMKITTG